LLIVFQQVFENVWCPTESSETLICSLNSSTTILFEETLYIFLADVCMHGRLEFLLGKDKSFVFHALSKPIYKTDGQIYNTGCL